MKFHLVADCTFEAPSLRDALIGLAGCFQAPLAGRESLLEVIGPFTLSVEADAAYCARCDRPLTVQNTKGHHYGVEGDSLHRAICDTCFAESVDEACGMGYWESRAE